MPIAVECRCGKTLKARDEHAGLKAKCPACGNTLVVPDPLAVPPTVAPIVLDTEPPKPSEPKVAAPASPSKAANLFGIASFVFGMLSVLVCWVPLLNVLVIPIAGIGLLLAIAGVFTATIGGRSGYAWPATGATLCVASFLAAAWITNQLAEAIKTPAVAPVRAKRHVVRQQARPAPAAPVAQAPPPPAPPAEPEFRDTIEDVRVRVASASVGTVPLQDIFRKPGQSEDRLLTITVDLFNGSDTRKLDYQTWGGSRSGFTENAAILKDDLGNTYKRINFGISTSVAGRVESDSIYPGKTLRDVLVFEPPVGKADHLILELPGQKIDAEGSFRLKIPANQIQIQP